MYNVNMQKGSAQILLIITALIVAIIGGLYFYQRSKTDNPQTSVLLNPQKVEENTTYTDQKLGFELKYPKQLILQVDTEEAFNQRGNGNFRKNFTSYVTYSPQDVLEAVVILDETGSFETNPLTVWVFNNPENLEVDRWYLNFWYYPFVWGDYTSRRDNVAPINEATLSGQVSKSGVVDYQPGKPKFIYISKDNKMYLFRIIGESGEKILQTFQFIN